MGSVVVITQLAEGDEVYAREFLEKIGYVHGDDYSSFSGVLISRQQPYRLSKNGIPFWIH